MNKQCFENQTSWSIQAFLGWTPRQTDILTSAVYLARLEREVSENCWVSTKTLKLSWSSNANFGLKLEFVTYPKISEFLSFEVQNCLVLGKFSLSLSFWWHPDLESCVVNYRFLSICGQIDATIVYKKSIQSKWLETKNECFDKALSCNDSYRHRTKLNININLPFYFFRTPKASFAVMLSLTS